VPAPHILNTLRRQMQEIAPPARHGRMRLDGGAMDAALGGGLPLGALHLIEGAGIEAETGAAQAQFLLPLLARLPGALFWLAPIADLYPPGLRAAGFDPARLIQIRTDAQDTLGIFETILRSRAAVAVVAEVEAIPHLAGRRLHMACLAGATTGFALRRFAHGRKPTADLTAAVTRWCLAPAQSHIQSHALGAPRQHAALRHSRAGPPADWIIQQEPHDAPYPFRVLAGLADSAPASRRLAG